MSHWRRAAQRERELNAANRLVRQAAQERAARRALDPCSCDVDCPYCSYTCAGGHANYPESHWCVNLHQWGLR